MEKERQVIIEEINMSHDSPSQRVGMLIDETLWPGHPLGRDIAGTRDSVSSISRKLMLDYLSDHYLPGNTVVAAAGDIQHEKMVNLVSQALDKWTGRQPKTRYLAYEENQFPRLCIEKRDLEQVHLCLALPGLSLLHPKRFAVDLLNVILGDGMSSRLFTNIRDKLGLAYSISSYVDHFLDTGALTIAASVETKNLTLAIKAIIEELAHLKDKVPETELNKAKEFSKGRLLLRMENSRSVAGWIGGQELLINRVLTVDEVVAIIDGITAEELQKLAEEVLLGDKLRLAIVGPVSPDAPLEELLRL
jgi:predicted Zn-dependent peptidase